LTLIFKREQPRVSNARTQAERAYRKGVARLKSRTAPKGRFFSHYLVGLYKRLDQNHVFLLAGGLSFSLFSCLVPFVLIIFSVIGRLLDVPDVQNQIDLFLNAAIPYPEVSAFLKEVFANRIGDFRLFRSTAGYLGIIGLLFASSGLFSSMRTILNSIYGVSKRRHIIVGKLRDFGMVLLVLLFFLMFAFILPVLEFFKGFYFIQKMLDFIELNFIEKQMISLLTFALMYGVFFMLYKFISYEKLKKRVVVVSAFWAALLWEIAKQLFGYYLTHAASLTRVYGAYLFVVAGAFWIYYSSIAFIAGGYIGQLYRERNQL
jgi:membrane protein